VPDDALAPVGQQLIAEKATKLAASAFSAAMSMRRAPSRAISVNGSMIEPGW
jgi:hypothetical protein